MDHGNGQQLKERHGLDREQFPTNEKQREIVNLDVKKDDQSWLMKDLKCWKRKYGGGLLPSQ